MKNLKSIFAIALCVVIIASLFAMAACGVSQEEVDKLNQQIEDLNTKLAAAEKEAKDNKALLDKANADKAAAEKMIEQYKDKPVAGTDNVDYELSDDGTYYIATGLKEGSDGAVVVLAREINGLPVKEIAENAFLGQNEEKVKTDEAISVIKAVYIPDNVTILGTKAFAECTQLSVAVMEGPFDVDASGVETFILCGISYFKVPEGQKALPAGFLRANHSLKTIDFGKTLEEIGVNCFFDCPNMADIIFPDSLKRIQFAAFWACFNITNANTPKNLEYLGAEAFFYCTKISGDWVMGENFKFLGKNALYLCTSINSLTFKVTEGWYSCTDEAATEGEAVTIEGNMISLFIKQSSEQKEDEPTRRGELFYKHN